MVLPSRRSFRATLLLFLGLFLSAGSFAQQEAKPKTIVLSYSEFGPQVAVHELIGYEWYQWNNHGDSNPNIIDDVRVVVYRNISLKKVKKMFPVSKEKRTDYRYLSYDSALKYPEKQEDEPYLEHLRRTSKKIIEKLGS